MQHLISLIKKKMYNLAFHFWFPFSCIHSSFSLVVPRRVSFSCLCLNCSPLLLFHFCCHFPAYETCFPLFLSPLEEKVPWSIDQDDNLGLCWGKSWDCLLKAKQAQPGDAAWQCWMRIGQHRIARLLESLHICIWHFTQIQFHSPDGGRISLFTWDNVSPIILCSHETIAHSPRGCLAGPSRCYSWMHILVHN